MSVTVTQQLTQQTVSITGNPVENNVVVTVSNARGVPGTGGASSITSATTSDGTANLSLANVTTTTAEVTGTLTAPHIHGNLAGSLYAHVRAAENLAKGDPVYVSGSHGSGATLIAEVSKADASNAAKMPAVGIMDAAVTQFQTGHMVISGTITELATNAYSINAELYVAAGGGLTATPPSARAQPVARVERSNLNNGAILVKVNGLSASDATGNTLVRRTSGGDASFGALNATALDVASSRVTIGPTGVVNFGATSSIVFDTATFTYGTGADAAHRTALGAGATGSALFTAATPAAARTTLGFDGLVPKVPFTVSLDSDFSTSSTSFVNATGLSFSAESGKRYALIFYLLTNKNDASGLALQFTGPASPTRVSLRILAATTSFATAAVSHLTALSSAITMNTFNGDGFALSNYGLIDNGSNAGTVQLQIRAVTGGTAKIYAGSYIQVTEL